MICILYTHYLIYDHFFYLIFFIIDQRILPVFKNYQPGAPSCRLYIKNLAKQVQTKDLHYIYRRYFIPGQEEQGTMYVLFFFLLIFI